MWQFTNNAVLCILQLPDSNKTKCTIETIFKLDDDFILNIIPMLRDFIEEGSSSDQVFQKNIDLLDTAENIILHYTEEGTIN